MYFNKGKLNRMCKSFRNKQVTVTYEHNDSQGGHQVRDAVFTYDAFVIRDVMGYYLVEFHRDGKLVFEQEFNNDWEFIGHGKLKLWNSGPYCYFTMKCYSFWRELHEAIFTK